jgi:hypothetical protein
MGQLADGELAELGRDVAQQLVGVDKITAVEVEAGLDSSEEPAYHFWFRWGQDPDWRLMGFMRLRLGQRLRDELMARGDPGYPFIHILTRQDWDARAGA